MPDIEVAIELLVWQLLASLDELVSRPRVVFKQAVEKIHLRTIGVFAAPNRTAPLVGNTGMLRQECGLPQGSRREAANADLV